MLNDDFFNLLELVKSVLGFLRKIIFQKIETFIPQQLIVLSNRIFILMKHKKLLFFSKIELAFFVLFKNLSFQIFLLYTVERMERTTSMTCYVTFGTPLTCGTCTLLYDHSYPQKQTARLYDPWFDFYWRRREL